MTTETYTIIIPAGGTGERLKEFLGGINKQFVKLGDKTILEIIIKKFFDYVPIREFIIALPIENFDNNRDYLLDRFPTLQILKGGETRQDSVFNCLKVVKSYSGKVIISDAVRPFFKKEELLKCIEKSADFKGVILAVKAKDTIRLGFKGISEGVIDRNKVWLVQTPQVFDIETLMQCYEKAFNEGFYGTDDAMLLERYGHLIAFVEGGYHNFKITHPFDFKVAEHLLNT